MKALWEKIVETYRHFGEKRKFYTIAVWYTMMIFMGLMLVVGLMNSFVTGSVIVYALSAVFVCAAFGVLGYFLSWQAQYILAPTQAPEKKGAWNFGNPLFKAAVFLTMAFVLVNLFSATPELLGTVLALPPALLIVLNAAVAVIGIWLVRFSAVHVAIVQNMSLGAFLNAVKGWGYSFQLLGMMLATMLPIGIVTLFFLSIFSVPFGLFFGDVGVLVLATILFSVALIFAMMLNNIGLVLLTKARIAPDQAKGEDAE